MANQSKIVVSGAREHNLKDVSLELPRDALVVITGLSGSGKSSLAFDTIYAEGQRRYVESLSAYARQFLGQMDKPDVDSIEGLSPAISIDQKTTSRNPRSTVGTVTEIYDYLRLLWSRIGKPHCHVCGAPIEGQSVEQIVDRVLDEIPERRALHGARADRPRAQGRVRQGLRGAAGATATRACWSTASCGCSRRTIELDKRYKHDIAVVVDRLVMRSEVRKRLTESVEAAVGLADGLVEVQVLPDRDGEARPAARCSSPSASPACAAGRRCPSSSRGSSRSTRRTARARAARASGRRWRSTRSSSCRIPTCRSTRGRCAVGEQRGELLRAAHRGDRRAPTASTSTTPWRELPEAERDLFLYGTAGERVQVTYRNRYGRTRTYQTRFEGIVTDLERRYARRTRTCSREKIEEYMSVRPCPECHGSRLRPESRSVLVSGMAIHEFTALSVRARARVGRRARAVGDRAPHRAAHPARDRRAPAVPRRRRHRLPVDGPRGGDAVGRRGAAHPAGDADRLGARRRALRARRAVDRPAPARQLEAHRDARAAARPRQHRARRRARRADDARGGQPRRPRPGRGRARRPDRRAGHGRRRSRRSRSR